jgi:selenoprotein W-related protein
LAAELSREFGVESELVPGEHGIFDVIVSGETVFSKHETGRFPEPGEVIEAIKKKTN